VKHHETQKGWQEGQYALLAGLYPIDSEFQVVVHEGNALGLAYTHAILSEKYGALQDAAGHPTSTYESAWELTF
jgi:hypothetical protein